MTWFIFALIPPVTWAIINYIDKFFLMRVIGSRSPKVFLVIELIVWIFVLALMYVIFTEDLSQSTTHAFYAFSGGLISSLGIYVYYIALRRADPTVVIPLFQFVPVFIAPIAFVLLGEVLTMEQLVAAGVIVAGGYLVSLRHIDDVVSLDRMTLLLMMLASLFLALGTVLFKMGNEVYAYWDTLFVSRIGSAAVPALFLFQKRVRTEAVEVLRLFARPRIAIIFGVRELLVFVALLSFLYAVTLAPAALVQAVSGLQPVFVLAIGGALATLIPHVFAERFDGKNLTFKLLGTVGVSVGLLLLLFW